MDKILGRDDFLTPQSLVTRKVEVPELGGSVYLRELSTSQILSFHDCVSEMQNGQGKMSSHQSLKVMALILSYSMCDEHGNPLFSESDVDAFISSNKINVIIALSTEVMRMSNVVLDAAMSLVPAQELKKVPSGSSSSDSLKSSRKRKRK